MRPTSPSRLRRRLAGTAVVVTFGVGSAGLAGCGSTSKPTVAALNAKLQKEQQLNSQFTAAQIHCVAGVFQRYGNAGSLDKYVAGKIKVGRLMGTTSEAAQDATHACLR